MDSRHWSHYIPTSFYRLQPQRDSTERRLEGVGSEGLEECVARGGGGDLTTEGQGGAVGRGAGRVQREALDFNGGNVCGGNQWKGSDLWRL
ncbi:hypothetical protein E2C01_100858 [Portunus trituberculatus]|uniref:Uncharacterized protein n=1 Tax=Portunus trituberculatus TaxID=210409 RepID=A0A5B7KDA1_PORTR|nr:hypothetical protein [Portunus trituberculatus]